MKYKINLLLLFALTTATCYCQKLSLDECLQMALETNPGMKISEYELEKASILKGNSFDAPNTGIELTQNAIEGGGMDNGLRFSQEFDFPTVYVARHKVNVARHQTARMHNLSEMNRIRGEVYSAYYSLAYANEKTGIIESYIPRYREFARVARCRYEEGDASKLEFLNASQMLSQIEMIHRNALVEKENAAIALQTVIGATSSVEIEHDKMPTIDIPFDIDDFSASVNPDSKVLQNASVLAEREVSLSKQEFMPGLSISATSQLLIKGFNPYHLDRQRFRQGDFMGFSVGISIPLFFGAKRSRLIAANRDLAIARLKVEDENKRIKSEYEISLNHLKRSHEDVAYYQKGGIEEAEEIQRLANVSYQLGEIGYQEFMQNIEMTMNIRLKYLECLNEFNQSVIKLQILKGEI